jgi:hypothetical protein
MLVLADALAGEVAGELDRDLIERFALHGPEPGRGYVENRFERLRDGRRLGKVAVRRLVHVNEGVERNRRGIARGGRLGARLR